MNPDLRDFLIGLPVAALLIVGLWAFVGLCIALLGDAPR